MTIWSPAEIEHGLLPFRAARRVVLRQLLDGLLNTRLVHNPFLLLSRLFVRLKSADSVLEKMRRKGIVLDTLDDLAERMPDALGARVIVDSLDELAALDELLRRLFEVRSHSDHTLSPTEYGGRGADYALRTIIRGQSWPFELQARTILQHHWAACSFHLFHKVAPDVARAHGQELRQLGVLLHDAEVPAANLVRSGPSTATEDVAPTLVPGIEDRVHLVAVEPGEQFAQAVIVPLTGDDRSDHDRTVAAKLDLYATFPGAAVVEACCLGMQSFFLNEPHVRVPLGRIDRVVGEMACSRTGNTV